MIEVEGVGKVGFRTVVRGDRSLGHWRGSSGIYFYWSRKSSLKWGLFEARGKFF